jgi:hypothetical protein
MDVDAWEQKDEQEAWRCENVVRLETSVRDDDGQEYKIMIIEGELTFDVAVQYPDGDREIIWNIMRELNPTT